MVPNPFTLSVVCITTDALSSAIDQRPGGATRAEDGAAVGGRVADRPSFGDGRIDRRQGNA
jgi:hypothetical protein